MGADGTAKMSVGQIWASQWRGLVLVGMAIAAFQQLTGINGVFFYSNTLFGAVGFTEAMALQQTLIITAFKIVGVVSGIRLVDKEVLEASRAYGANAWQQLFGVQIPLALPNIMAGINQTTMMALAMVVIASMIGATGLGQEVLLGINRLEVGRGLMAGVSIVVLAILFDRIPQAYGRRQRRGAH